MGIGIDAIEYYFPKNYLTNEDFERLGVNKEFMREKIGIERRFISAEDESVGDMAVKAANKLFERQGTNRSSIDALILCTQNPDYTLPTTACIVQDTLGLPKSCSAFDVNLGCSGFVYSSMLAYSLINTFGFGKALVITSEAYSKVISYEDKTTATIFSDAAAAVLISGNSANSEFISFSTGTDGSGFDNLIVPAGGSRMRRSPHTSVMREYSPGVKRSDENLFMDGHEITKFVFREVPKSVADVISKSGQTPEQIGKFFFHQANKYILNALAERMSIPSSKVYVDLSRGNTVSSTIPIALKDYFSQTPPRPETVLMCGFGVGYSWGSSIMKVFDKL